VYFRNLKTYKCVHICKKRPTDLHETLGRVYDAYIRSEFSLNRARISTTINL
jgi:hypothetical protein